MIPKTNFSSILGKSPIISFCLITFSITWGLKLLYAWYKSHYGMPVFNFSFFASFGPTISALILILVVEGLSGFANTFKKLFDWYVGLKWILLATFFEPLVFGTITLGYWLFYGEFSAEFRFDFLTDIPSYISTFVIGLFIWGFSEEIGWRGWMLPKLQSRMSPFVASCVLAIIASLWHLNPNLLSEVFVNKEGLYLYLFSPEILERIIISVPFTMVITYIFNQTKGNLLLMLCFHSASNTSYFWIDGVFGIVKTDFFRISFTFALAIIFVIFSILLLKQQNKVTS